MRIDLDMLPPYFYCRLKNSRSKVSRPNGRSKVAAQKSGAQNSVAQFYRAQMPALRIHVIDFIQLSRSMSVQNMTILAVAKEIVVLATNYAKCFEDS